MKWTKHNSLFSSSMSTRSVRPFIPSVLFSLLLVVGFLVPSSSVADDASDITHIRGTVDIISEYIQDTQMDFLQDWKQDQLDALGEVVPAAYQDRVLKTLYGGGLSDSFSWSSTDNIRAYLQTLSEVFGSKTNPSPGTLLDYQKKQLSRLTETLFLLDAISNYLSVLVSNGSSSGISPDILAGNPWWATNSAFALTRPKYSSVFPDDGTSATGVMSFPQFLSKWSGFLTIPVGSTRPITPSQLESNWSLFFGRGAGRLGGNATTDEPYTWFDFMADATRSNWVLQASILDRLGNLSGGSNVVNVSVGLTNILTAQDILAGNPWWATNSGFALDWYNIVRSGAFPSSSPYYSFPQMLSYLSAASWQPNISDYPYDVSYLDRWGKYGPNWKMGVITFNDWLADYLKSNLVSYASTFDDEYRASQLDSSTTSVAEEGYLALTNAVEEATETADEATSLEPSFSPTTESYSNPYDPIGELITTVGEDISDKMPEFNESTDEIITLFDGRSGTPMDAAGAVQVNLREAMGEHVNTLGNVMSWFWTTLNAILTIVLVVRSLHEIGEAI